MEWFLSVLLGAFRWSKLSTTEKSVVRVAWLVVLVMMIGVLVTALIV